MLLTRAILTVDQGTGFGLCHNVRQLLSSILFALLLQWYHFVLVPVIIGVGLQVGLAYLTVRLALSL